ncbi:hypothetical protein [Sphingomonas jinjuensis]|nr:hypothetical protein [Sphingomonas jinjuensis]
MSLLFLAVAVSAMPVQATTGPDRLPTAQDGDEIIVEALRIPRSKLPTGVYWNDMGRLEAKVDQEQRRLYFRCALSFSDPLMLRRVVDGEPNGAMATHAQGHIVLKGRACQPGLSFIAKVSTEYPNVIDYGRRPQDRGAIIELALQRYSPDATLTAAETQDPVVQQRYRQREYARNRLRLPADRNAWLVTSCLVREQPELATRLTRAQPGSNLERGLIQTMLVEGRTCLGGVKRLTVEPATYRPYIVDAFYRWVVAARNVASLIPAA